MFMAQKTGGDCIVLKITVKQKSFRAEIYKIELNLQDGFFFFIANGANRIAVEQIPACDPSHYLYIFWPSN